ncbi:MAG: ATP synthase F1 subunit gamma [Chlorobi bacterium]|nr:ATP synthase F1 subunit gamma [Chlorobiota bacterium]
MATLRDIKQRIVGVKNTQKITKAMKMVAAARLRKAQERMMEARPYSRKIAELLTRLVKSEQNYHNPFFENREVENIAVLLITSDRGLCGGFNANVIKQTEELLKNDYPSFVENGTISLYPIGRKGKEYFARKEIGMLNSHINVFSDLKFEFAASVVSGLTKKFLDGEIDKVLVVSNKFKSVAQQNLSVTQLLPIESVEEINEVERESSGTEYIYEPDRASIIGTLLPRYLNSQMWQLLLESYAAELGARMTAMDMATENATELIGSLQLTYNKARQAAITKEILEIVSGANALQD